MDIYHSIQILELEIDHTNIGTVLQILGHLALLNQERSDLLQTQFLMDETFVKTEFFVVETNNVQTRTMDYLKQTHNMVKSAVTALLEAQAVYDEENQNWSASATSSDVFKDLLNCQNNLRLAMGYWQSYGGRPATWATYYDLLGYDASQLTEEAKNTLVTYGI